MWSKEEEQTATGTPSIPPRPASATTCIGPSVVIRGTVEGREDLRLEGRVDGEVSNPNHRVIIGKSGRVKADVSARIIEVEGSVVGDLNGSERVVVAATGNVRGNIKAPRVSLENGAQFKGSIDMDPASVESASKSVVPGRKGPKPADPTAISSETAPKANASNS